MEHKINKLLKELEITDVSDQEVVDPKFKEQYHKFIAKQKEEGVKPEELVEMDEALVVLFHELHEVEEEKSTDPEKVEKEKTTDPEKVEKEKTTDPEKVEKEKTAENKEEVEKKIEEKVDSERQAMIDKANGLIDEEKLPEAKAVFVEILKGLEPEDKLSQKIQLQIEKIDKFIEDNKEEEVVEEVVETKEKQLSADDIKKYKELFLQKGVVTKGELQEIGVEPNGEEFVWEEANLLFVKRMFLLEYEVFENE